MKDLKEIGFYTLSDERVKNTSVTSQMKRCEMIITEACNFRCPYCRGLEDHIYGDRKVKQLSLSEIMRNIDYWCENQPLENIRFSGGEPTLHKNLVEIVAYAKQKGIKRVAISTNGSASIDLYRKLSEAGVYDFSISLDACCAEDGDKMAGGIKGAWERVVRNIREISSWENTYVTVGVVLTPDNIEKTIETIYFAHDLGVDDIRIISAAQYNKPIPRLDEVESYIREAHPILDYRIKHFAAGINVRGILLENSNKCALMLDDSVIAGNYHFPCIIYMREKGNPIGEVSPNMRQERKEWLEKHDTHADPICRNQCLDVCIQYNDKYRELRE